MGPDQQRYVCCWDRSRSQKVSWKLRRSWRFTVNKSVKYEQCSDMTLLELELDNHSGVSCLGYGLFSHMADFGVSSQQQNQQARWNLMSRDQRPIHKSRLLDLVG